MAADRELIDRIRASLRAAGDPAQAPRMQAYMKSAMPYLGVRLPAVRLLTNAVAAARPFTSIEDLADTVRALWREAEFREERYAASELTGLPLAAGRAELLPLYREMITTGAWWDHVDALAHRLLGLLAADPVGMSALLREWSTDADLWIRRSSIIAQLGARQQTDRALLTNVIEPNLADREFFIRKAIGWALRDYARVDPDWVRAFVATHDGLSPLSRREALKHL